MDPFGFALKCVFELLGDLFEQDYENGLGCNCKCEISAFHHGTEGEGRGQHLQVSWLTTGILLPPQASYIFIWHVQVLINYLKKDLSDNKKLTNKYLTLKVTGFSALSSNHGCSLHNLSIKFVARNEVNDSFLFNKLSKSWRQGQKPPGKQFLI